MEEVHERGRRKEVKEKEEVVGKVGKRQRRRVCQRANSRLMFNRQL